MVNIPTILRARWVAPIDRPIIDDGALALDETGILAVGEIRDVRSQFAQVAIEDLGDVVLMPGLVNAHTHLELSNCTCEPPPSGTSGETSFTDWILSLPRRLGRDKLTPAQIFPAATRSGIAQCHRFGVTTVGDISQQMHLTRPVLRESRLRAVSYGEVIGLAQRRHRFEELFSAAIDRSHDSELLTTGLTPHAPYTVDLRDFQRCVQAARELGLPIATHLAEIPDESEFLRSQSGQLKEMWESLGFWSDDVKTFDGSPIEFAKAVGLLDCHGLLAHVNYLDDAELKLLADGNASVVYCPRTHAFFGHRPHRWREMMEAGINVALGTDSCASSPDLNVLDDARLVLRQHPDVPVETLIEMVTIRGARALGLDSRIGTLTPGKAADIAAFPASGTDPLRTILESDTLPLSRWLDGVPS